MDDEPSSAQVQLCMPLPPVDGAVAERPRQLVMLQVLDRCMAEHRRRAERHPATAAYPELRSHVASHQRMTSALGRLRRRLQSRRGDPRETARSLADLADSVVVHINLFDRELSRCREAPGTA